MSEQRALGRSYLIPGQLPARARRFALTRTPAPARIFPHHDIEPMPSTMERAYIKVQDHEIECRIMRAPHERGVVAAVSGFKSPNPLRAETVEEYNRQGLSVIWMALPNPGTSRGFMSYFKRCVDRFLLDRTSPVYTQFPANLPRFVHGHSTGGFLVTRLLLGKKTGSFMARHFMAATMDAPFFDTAGASLDDSALSRTLFTAYAMLHPDSLPQNTLMGRIFLHHDRLNRRLLDHAPLPDASRIEKIGYRAALILRASTRTIKELLPHQEKIDFFGSAAQNNREFIIPTYGQMLEIREHGRQFYKKSRQHEVTAGIPTLMIGGKGDSASSTLQIMKTARHIGAEFYQANAGHATIDTDIIAKEKALAFITVHLPALPEPAIVADVPQTPRATESWPDYIRTKLALRQRAASLTDSFTRLTQGLFGRGVADTEVRAESESRALHASHAHTLQ